MSAVIAVVLAGALLLALGNNIQLRREVSRLSKETSELRNEAEALREAARAYDTILQNLRETEASKKAWRSDLSGRRYVEVVRTNPFNLASFTTRLSDGRVLNGRELHRMLWGKYSEKPERDPIEIKRKDGEVSWHFVPTGYPFLIEQPVKLD